MITNSQTMKRLFKFLFNLVRTLSLIFVLLLMAAFAYGHFSGALQKLIGEEPFKRLAYSWFAPPITESHQTEKERTFWEDKIWLPGRRATHFVRPAQTAFSVVTAAPYMLLLLKKTRYPASAAR